MVVSDTGILSLMSSVTGSLLSGECYGVCVFFFFQAEDGIRDWSVTGVQTCALPISILACSGVTTSMMTPPLSISAMPRFTRVVPVPVSWSAADVLSVVGVVLTLSCLLDRKSVV